MCAIHMNRCPHSTIRYHYQHSAHVPDCQKLWQFGGGHILALVPANKRIFDAEPSGTAASGRFSSRFKQIKYQTC